MRVEHLDLKPLYIFLLIIPMLSMCSLSWFFIECSINFRIIGGVFIGLVFSSVGAEFLGYLLNIISLLVVS